MILLVILVFLGVFGVLTLLLIGSGLARSEQTKRTLAVLESALTVEKAQGHDDIVDLRKDELLSAVPWLNRWMQKLEIAPRLRILLYQANLKWTVGGLILMAAAAFVFPGYLFYLRTGNIIFALLIGIACGGAPFIYVRQKRKQRFNKFEEELPVALDLAVSALRAGHSLVAALGLVGEEGPSPVAGEFRICFEEQNYGLELRTAVVNLVTRVPLQDLKIVTTAILIQKDSGGNLAEVLDKTAYVIRERFRLKRQVRVHTAQGRLTGWILSILPFALGFGLYLISPEQMSLLWTTPIGIKLLYIAVFMMITGALIIRKIVNMKV